MLIAAKEAIVTDTIAATKLPVTERRLHRRLTESMLATGDIPPAASLASELGVSLKALGSHLRTLAEGDYLGFDAAGRLTCLYPFSVTPTPHVVVLDGARRFAMCSLDALGMAAMFGREVDIESACPACGTPIRLRVRPGAVASVEPTGALVVARRDAETPAYEACCGFTVFACGLEHADPLLARTSHTTVLDPPKALVVADAIFAAMLGDTLPAERTRAPLPSEGR